MTNQHRIKDLPKIERPSGDPSPSEDDLALCKVAILASKNRTHYKS
ncbi:MAG: hypothetical protein Q8O13_10230 [Candidatus Omnitrophota bacterium]|nr:hypothetical protein [Candidatus Omnitrophota bacterium]